MGSITLKRTLTLTDFGKSQSHGGVIIPNGGQYAGLDAEIRDFFDGVKTYRSFIDVRDREKVYKIQYADYTSNGSTPNDRVTPINKYASKHGLEECDTLILERIDTDAERIYLIDYAKKLQSIYLKGKRKGKAIVSSETKVDGILMENVHSGVVAEPMPGEYHFDAKYGRTIGTAIIKKNANLYELWFNGQPIGLDKDTSFEITFSASRAVIKKSTGSWDVIIDKPELYSKYMSASYIEEEISDEIHDEDIEGASGNYTPGCIEKKELKNGKHGRKIYPRDKKISANALKRANNTCENKSSHKSFLRRNKKIKYMEPHHLIPLHMHEEFSWSLDVEANIVSLCSNCHNQIHYGDGADIIKKLFNNRRHELAAAGIDVTKDGIALTEEELLKYYGYK